MKIDTSHTWTNPDICAVCRALYCEAEAALPCPGEPLVKLSEKAKRVPLIVFGEPTVETIDY